jgi:hypothetical protein
MLKWLPLFRSTATLEFSVWSRLGYPPMVHSCVSSCSHGREIEGFCPALVGTRWKAHSISCLLCIRLMLCTRALYPLVPILYKYVASLFPVWYVPCLLCVALAGQFLGVYTSNPTPRSSSYSLSVSFCVTRPYGVAGRMGGFLLEASGIFWEPEIFVLRSSSLTSLC